jgi:hypothetical protein
MSSSEEIVVHLDDEQVPSTEVHNLIAQEQKKEFDDLEALGSNITLLQAERLADLRRTFGSKEEQMRGITLGEAIRLGLMD